MDTKRSDNIASSGKWYPTDSETTWYLPWVNLAAYILNVGITYGSIDGWFGATNTVLSKKYMTIVTPAGWAFSIWGLIFMMEALFVLFQLDVHRLCFPSWSSLKESDVLHRGVSFFWAFSCVAQVCWTFAFAQEVIWLSLFFMLSIWVALFSILYRTYFMQKSIFQFWFLVAPFEIHLGWITAASFVNLNVTVINGMGCIAGKYKTECSVDDISGMHAAGFISVAFLVMIAFYLSLCLSKPNIWTTGVVAWALTALQAQLATLAKDFPDFYAVFENSNILPGLRTGVIFFAITTWSLVVFNLIRLTYHRLMSSATSEDENNEKDIEQAATPASFGTVRSGTVR